MDVHRLVFREFYRVDMCNSEHSLDTNTTDDSDSYDTPPPNQRWVRASYNVTSPILVNMYDTTQFETLRDVVFDVQGELLFAHKAVLASVSPVFKTMFTNGMKETKSAEMPLRIELFETTFEIVQKLLCFIYKGKFLMNDEISDETLMGLLKLAHMYQIEMVLRPLEAYLADENIFEENFAKLWIFAVSYDFPLVRRAVVSFCDFNARESDFISTSWCKSIPRDLMSYLAKRPEILDYSFALNFVVSWIQADENNRRCQVDSLLDSLQLANMNTYELSQACEKLSRYSAHSVIAKKLQNESQVRLAEIPSASIAFPKCHTNTVRKYLKTEKNKRVVSYSEAIACRNPNKFGLSMLQTRWVRLLNSPYEARLKLYHTKSNFHPFAWVDMTLEIASISTLTTEKEDSIDIMFMPFIGNPECCSTPARSCKFKLPRDSHTTYQWHGEGYAWKFYNMDSETMSIGATLVGNF